MNRDGLLFTIALIAAVLGVQSCSAIQQGGGGAASEPKEPVPTVNHAVHAARDLECIDCHDPEERGTPLMPTVESCFECHENLEEETEAVRAYFDAVRQPDGTYLFARLSYGSDIVAAHKVHADKEVSCAECHGEPSEKAFTRPDLFAFKQQCMQCHEKQAAPLTCAACHKEIRKDKKPQDHDARYLETHGANAPVGWQRGENTSCQFCHSVPNSCNTCHRETQPSNHRRDDFLHNHGKGDTDAADEPFKDTSCALCHKEQSCVICHQQMKPRSHTVPFERRLHGIVAGVDRESCRACHQQDWCNRCHETTRPVSHRGQWGTGRQTHCYGCHEPVSSVGCFVCHKSTVSHLSATPLPADDTHRTATTCLNCHLIIPHVEDGDGAHCRRCHR